MKEIEVRGLCKTFGSLRVVEDVDLSVSRGEVVTLVGPSGSGKSTLLRCLNLLEMPDAGELLWQGRAVSYRAATEKQLCSYRRQVGMVFQHFHLFPHLTVQANVMEGPSQVLGWETERAAERALALLSRVGLSSKADAYPGQLSGGQKQRVAIARALALEPKALLLDEVTSALDIEMVSDINELLCELAQSQSMTMVVVTHDLAFAQRVSHRIGFMEAGRLLELGTSEQMLSQPENPRARSFLSLL